MDRNPPNEQTEYDRLIRQARARLDIPVTDGTPVSDEDAGGEDPVQLSVRLAPRLRTAVAEVARGRGRSVTGFVIETLEDAVRAERDPFAGLAADLAANFRDELARAVSSGAYAEAAAEVDAAEREWAAG